MFGAEASQHTRLGSPMWWQFHGTNLRRNAKNQRTPADVVCDRWRQCADRLGHAGQVHGKIYARMLQRNRPRSARPSAITARDRQHGLRQLFVYLDFRSSFPAMVGECRRVASLLLSMSTLPVTYACMHEHEFVFCLCVNFPPPKVNKHYQPINARKKCLCCRLQFVVINCGGLIERVVCLHAQLAARGNLQATSEHRTTLTPHHASSSEMVFGGRPFCFELLN